MVDQEIIRQRIKDRSEIDPETGCWEWLGYRSPGGYGMIQVRRLTHSPVGAHRMSAYALKYILHTCDNPPCVNPDHLFLGTPKDNVHDMIKKGRATNVATQNFGRIAKVTEDQVREIRKRRKSGESAKNLCCSYGLSRSNINRIINRDIWKHVV